MDYYQKYIKYKAKYVATQTGGNVADLTENAIPPELQMLDDAFLPGFNVDKAYVEPLLAASIANENSIDVIKFLQALNNTSDGLNKKGDRLIKGKQTKQSKDAIGKALSDMLQKPDDENRKEALQFFKIVEKIRNANVNTMKGNSDKQLEQFQNFDDVFLPGFNVDKDFVGHLLYYILTSNNNSTSVVKKLIGLNKKLTSVFKKKMGLNEKGNRMAQGKSFKGKEIQKELEKLEKNPPSFPDISAFTELQQILKKIKNI